MDDLALAELSAAAYDEPAAWARGDVHAIRRDIDARTTVVAFRGTCDAASALRDARAWGAYDPWLGWCHAGFLEGARSVAPQMMADLSGRRVIFTGHSLGGALAILAGAMFVAAGCLPRAIVTFGAPRLGWWKLRRVARQVPSVRLRHLNDDPVPTAPFWFLSGGPVIPLVGRWALDPFDEHPIAAYLRALKTESAPLPAPAASKRPFS